MSSDVVVPSEVASLEPFVRAGVFGATEVHTVATFARHAADPPHAVLLAAALAVRAPLHGHVCVDLTDARTTVVSTLESSAEVTAVGTDTHADVPADPPGPVTDDVTGVPQLDELDWPDADGWLDAVTASPLVAQVDPGDDGPVPRDAHGHLVPLVVEHGRLYLTRFWSLERYVAADLGHRAAGTDGSTGALAGATTEIERLFRAGEDAVDADQLAAAIAGVEQDLVVIAGGPGTGKTSTVARLLAGLVSAERGRDPEQPALRIALGAPTGKAAARMTEALRGAVRALSDHLDEAVVAELDELEAVTLHRLLGRGDGAGFRHGPGRPLPHDVVIVDEVSMVSLSLMAHLLAAVRPDATVVLVGDPFQLASVEAGAVLGDIVAGAAGGIVAGAAGGIVAGAAGGIVAGAAGGIVAGAGDDLVARAAGGIAASVRPLRTVHRQREGSGILEVATAIRDGDADGVIDLLRSDRDDLHWFEVGDDGTASRLDTLQGRLGAAAQAVVDAASAGDVDTALRELSATKVLCAHRRGDMGVEGWNRRIERQLGIAGSRDGGFADGAWYVGRPVMVTRNDYLNGVFNGDVGVATDDGGHDVVWFPRAGGAQRVESARLDRIATQWAMSIHKSQGSEFDHVVVTLPAATSRILTRELLYTAITRARSELTVVAAEGAIRTAVERPVARASGLAVRLRP